MFFDRCMYFYLEEALRRHFSDGLEGVGGEAAVVQRVVVFLWRKKRTKKTGEEKEKDGQGRR